MNNYFGNHLTLLYKKSHEISSKILSILCSNIGYSYTNDLQKAIDSDDIMPSVLRVLRYVSLTNPSLSNQEIELGADHTDIGLVTIMPCSSMHSLQILSNDGEWIDAEEGRTRNIVTVIGGEQLAFLSNHYFKATRHRVLNNVSGRRISFPFLMRLPRNFWLRQHKTEEVKVSKDILNHVFHKE